MAKNIKARSADYAQWYLDVIKAARLADYAPVRGCMVIRPEGFAIWEAIQRNLDYLAEVLRTGRWPMLWRDPPCFTWERNPVQNIRSLVIGHLKQVWKSS